MKKAVLSNRIYLNRTKELQDILQKALTYKLPPKKPGFPYIEESDLTRINKDILTIPIGRLDLIPKDFEIVDNRILAPATFPQFKETLRDTQQEVYNELTDSCIIRANPSWGKTFMGVSIATKLKQKTLIIVHTKYLKDQWVKEVKKCLGITPGMIGGGDFDIDSPIVIATVQTLRNRISELWKVFGLIIVDECHHVPASVFKSIVDKFNARYKIGLTATPWRKDGRHVMLYNYFGGQDEEFIPKDENRLDPKIIVIETQIPFSSNAMIPWGIRLNELYDNHEYMELILNLAHAQAERGHLVLVVADRVEFLQTCADVLDDSMLVVGPTEDRDFLKSGKKVLFGSSKIYAEGINIPPLSCLIIAMPVNNRTLLEQLIGRICREHPGKKIPEVIDIRLKGKTGKNQSAARINFYMDNDYNIRYIDG